MKIKQGTVVRKDRKVSAGCVVRKGQAEAGMTDNKESYSRVLGEEHSRQKNSRYKGLGHQHAKHVQRTERRPVWLRVEDKGKRGTQKPDHRGPSSPH